MKLELSIAMTRNLRTQAIFDGTVTADGIDLIATELHPSEMFWRQLKFGDFDISELSFSSLMMAASRGDDRWVGLPVFTTRHFFQNWILVRKAAGIDRPEDMAGKRVGVPEYQQTAAVWSRGILEHDFGVTPRDMEFWMERAPAQSHGGATGFQTPPGVTLHRIAPDKNIGAMMLSGELDATLLYFVDPNLIDRSTADLWHHPDIRPLFDPVAEGRRYFRQTGIFPLNHGMAIRRSIVEKHPWIVLNVYKAFVRANELAEAQRMTHVEYHLAAGLLPVEAHEALRAPLVRHGIKANRPVLETAARYSLEQGLTPRLISLDEVFARSTMDL